MNKRTAITLALVVALIGAIIVSQTQFNAGNATESAQSDATLETPVAAPVDGQATATDVKLEPKVNSPLLANAPLESDFYLGAKDAPVTLVEYASLSCPHCANFHQTVLSQLKTEYIDTGKLLYVLRPFPLTESAMSGAMLVQCVGEMSGNARYYKFSDVLFDAQNKWAFDSNFKESLKTFATVGGVSDEEFTDCLRYEEREKYILQVRKQATDELGVDGTPYIFLNGHPHKGNKQFESVKKEIDALLAATQQPSS